LAEMASANAAATSAASVNPLAGPSSATSSNGTFWATSSSPAGAWLLGPRLTSQTLEPGEFFCQVGRLVKRVAGPRVEDGGQHHFIFQRGAGDRLQSLERSEMMLPQTIFDRQMLMRSGIKAGEREPPTGFCGRGRFWRRRSAGLRHGMNDEIVLQHAVPEAGAPIVLRSGHQHYFSLDRAAGRIHWCHANGQNQFPFGRVIINNAKSCPSSPKNPGVNE